MNPNGLREIEDLIPPELCVAAAASYVEEFVAKGAGDSVREIAISSIPFASHEGTHDAIEAATRAVIGPDFHLDKVGFARNIIAVLERDESRRQLAPKVVKDVERNFRLLFERLGVLQRRATRVLEAERTDSAIARVRHRFVRDHPKAATKNDALTLIEEIEAVLERTGEAEDYRAALRKLALDFQLRVDVAETIQQYDKFTEALTSLIYLQERMSQDDAAGRPDQEVILESTSVVLEGEVVDSATTQSPG